jgi:2-polyprenyl-6-methoxyphenol hydroxylase-like FAD-dependent oxidoreductase
VPSGRAVIVGGGIGGLAAALELRRVGFDVVVLERRPELAEVDTGFLLWSFAIRRLRSLGLGAGLDAIGRPVERLVTRSWRGETLSDLSLSALSRRAGAPSCDVHRARLQQLLADALGDRFIRLGARCTGVSADGVVLEDGERVAGDLVVGADGVNSAVRRELVGEIALRRDDVGIWRGMTEVGTELVPEGVHIRVMGPGALFGAGRIGRHAVRWYAGGWGLGQGALAERFEGWCEPVGELIRATDEEAILFNDAPRAAPLRRWARGRVALLGDAAHPALPTLATGGGMAIEDAGVLAECLRHASTAEALHRYQRARRRPTARVQRASTAFGYVLGFRSPAAVRARDLAFGHSDAAQRRVMARLMRGP